MIAEITQTARMNIRANGNDTYVETKIVKAVEMPIMVRLNKFQPETQFTVKEARDFIDALNEAIKIQTGVYHLGDKDARIKQLEGEVSNLEMNLRHQ